jgi:DUF4097 and DUF4098 domain-containing protein YvlB
MKRIAVLTVIAILCVTPVWAQRAVNEVRQVSPEGIVDVSNLAGSVHIIGGSGDRVEITGTLGKNVEDLEIWGDGTRLSIEVDVPRHVDDLETELVITMPASASLEVETVSATIEVEGISGAMDLESVSGWIRVSGQPAEISAESVSGEVMVAYTANEAYLGTVSGAIKVLDGAGSLDAESVSGNIEVSGGQFQSVSKETVSGNQTFSADLGARGDFEFETMSGVVTLNLPASVSADFEVETFSGSIVNTIGPEARNISQYTPQKELSFTAGSGGAQVYISSFSGSVNIQTR